MNIWRIHVDIHSKFADRLSKELGFRGDRTTTTMAEGIRHSIQLENHSNAPQKWLEAFAAYIKKDPNWDQISVTLHKEKEVWSLRLWYGKGYKYREQWAYKDEDMYYEHRLNGPAIYVEREDDSIQKTWFIHGKRVDSFEEVIADKTQASWEKYIENKPERIPIILELADNGILQIPQEVIENFKAMHTFLEEE